MSLPPNRLTELPVPAPLRLGLRPPIEMRDHFVFAAALLLLGWRHRISNRRGDFTDLTQHSLCSFVGPPTAILSPKNVKIMVVGTINREKAN